MEDANENITVNIEIEISATEFEDIFQFTVSKTAVVKRARI
jgi:hypothetical protein